MKTLTNLITKVLIILISTIGVVSCGDSPEELNQKGYDYFKVGNYAEAVKYFKLSAEQGCAKGQGSLGVMYAHGAGVEQNYNEAAKWAKLAAEQGLAEAQALLALLYSQGWGVEQNDYEAEKWLKLAAEQGYEPAITLLNSSEDRIYQ